MAKTDKAIIYVLHFSEPLSHARHYVGSTTPERLDERIEEHRNGQGARITQVAVERGIKLMLALAVEGTREDERRVKDGSHGSGICPECGGTGRIPAKRKLKKKRMSAAVTKANQQNGLDQFPDLPL